MKKNIFYLVFVMFLMSMASANAQQINTMEDGISVDQKKLVEVDQLTLEYIEAMGSRKHDQIMLKTADGKIYWKGRYIEGFFLGAVGGGTYMPHAKSFSYVGGLEVGYTMWWGDLLVTPRVGEIEFDGKRYVAPSAFAEVRFNLGHFAKNKKQRIYLGARIGYQYTEADNSVHEEGPDFEFNRVSSLKGSGLGYGVVFGWETRQFMGGNRFGVQLAGYTYDVQHVSQGMVNGKPTSDENIIKQGWQLELTLSYRFQFGKTRRNY